MIEIARIYRTIKLTSTFTSFLTFGHNELLSVMTVRIRRELITIAIIMTMKYIAASKR